MLGFQVPRLVNGTQLQAQVDAAAQSYAQQLSQRYPGGVPAGTVLGDPGQPAQPGVAQTAPDGTLAVPAITGPIPSHQAITAVVAIAADGTVVASSAPSRYPPGRAAAGELPAPAAAAIADGVDKKLGSVSDAVRQRDLDDLAGEPRRQHEPRPSAPGPVAYVYVQAPWSARVHQPHPRLGRAASARRDRRAAGGLLRAALRHRAGRGAVRAAGLTPPRPPGAPPGTSHPRGRRRRLHRHPARLRPGRGRPAGGELHHHDPPARLRAGRRTAARHRRRARRGTSPDRAGDPRRDLPAPVRPADDRRRDAPGRPGQPAGATRSSASARRRCATCRRS